MLFKVLLTCSLLCSAAIAVDPNGPYFATVGVAEKVVKKKGKKGTARTFITIFDAHNPAPYAIWIAQDVYLLHNLLAFLVWHKCSSFPDHHFLGHLHEVLDMFSYGKRAHVLVFSFRYSAW